MAEVDSMGDIWRLSSHYKTVFIAFSHSHIHSTLSPLPRLYSKALSLLPRYYHECYPHPRNYRGVCHKIGPITAVSPHHRPHLHAALYLCPLSSWLTVPWESMSRCCPSRLCMVLTDVKRSLNFWISVLKFKFKFDLHTFDIQILDKNLSAIFTW